MLELDFNAMTIGENNSQFAYRVLRKNIMSMNLAPGSTLNEKEISEQLNISRTPIREAFFRLKEERLVDIYPQKISIVSLIDLDLVREGIFLRRTVESAVLEIANGNLSAEAINNLGENLELERFIIEGSGDVIRFFDLDYQFHFIIYKSVNKSRVWEAMRSVTTHYDRVRYFDIIKGNTRLGHIYEQHNELYKTLVTGKSLDLKQLVQDHLSGYQTILPTILAEYRNYFKISPSSPQQSPGNI